jgi:glycosyl transferase family 25
MAELRRADLGIWLINLDRDTGRLARMQQQLDAMGLDYTRFAAIDGRAQADELAARVDAAAYARNMGQNVTPAISVAMPAMSRSGNRWRRPRNLWR